MVWETFVGPIPEKMVINHINTVRDDNRIENLEAVSHQRNIIHAVENGLFGDRKGSANANSKISKEDVIEIKRRRSMGETCISISRDYPISRGMVNAICLGKSWKD